MSTSPSIAQSTHSPHSHYLPAIFCGLLALTAAVRLVGVARPLLGNFSTKNVVYAMIARNWARGIAGPCYPTVDLLGGGKRCWSLVDFPVAAHFSGGLWRVLGGSLDVWGRTTAVAFSTAAVAMIFLLVRRRHGAAAAIAAALALALSPVSIIYGQSFMMEASLVFFTVATFYSLDRWLDGDGLVWPAIATVCLALLLLTKIYMLVLLLPLAWMVYGPERRRNRLARARFPCVLALAVAPAALWYIMAWQTASPQGPFAERIYYSVRQSAEAHPFPHPLLFSADFYRQVLDDLSGVVLTPVGLVLALVGLSDRRWRQHAAWMLAMAALMLALPRKFFEMNYYYLAILPPLCVMAGLGWRVIRQRVRRWRTAAAVLLAAAVVFSLRYAVRPAFLTPQEDRGVVAAGRAIRSLTAPDEPVVTMHGTAPDLLYYCDRPGWAVGPDEPVLAEVLDDCRRQGARYLVVVGQRPPLEDEHPVTRGDDFQIHRLPGRSVAEVEEGEQ